MTLFKKTQTHSGSHIVLTICSLSCKSQIIYRKQCHSRSKLNCVWTGILMLKTEWQVYSTAVKSYIVYRIMKLAQTQQPLLSTLLESKLFILHTSLHRKLNKRKRKLKFVTTNRQGLTSSPKHIMSTEQQCLVMLVMLLGAIVRSEDKVMWPPRNTRQHARMILWLFHCTFFIPSSPSVPRHSNQTN